MTIPVFYPMGAVTPKEEHLEALWKDPKWICERKYDGSRYLIRKENGKVSIVSRQPSVETGLPVDKTDRVPHLAKLFEERMPDGSVLDGEIITHENCESNEVTSIMGSNPDLAIQKQEERGYVKYVVFDILYWSGLDLTHYKYIERRKALENVYKKFLAYSDYLILAPIYTQNKLETYEKIVAEGGEGVILKNALAPYQLSLDPKRVKKPKDTWLKVKKYNTYDVVIMGYTEPTKEYSREHIDTWNFWIDPEGNPFYRQNQSVASLEEKGYKAVTKPYYYDWIGAIRFGQYKDGELIEIGQTSGISDDVKQYIADNKEALLGRVIEVGAMRQNRKTLSLVHPRFLRLRPDKLAEQCIAGKD